MKIIYGIKKISKKAFNMYNNHKTLFWRAPLLFIISLFITSISSTAYFSIKIVQLNNLITLKQGEINEIEIYRENLKDIDDKYTNLVLDILEKDYEIYQSTKNMNMSEYEAINIMRNYAHRAYQLFKDFVMASDSKYFIYIDYNILEEFQDKMLQPWWSEQSIYERTWNIIYFEILISENDNMTEYLYKRTPWGEINLNNFLENKSQAGTSDLINLINETRATNIFWYDKTWEILYNYSHYGVININVDLQLYDRIVQIYYEKPLLDLKNKIMDYDIWVALSSVLVILSTVLLDIIVRKSPKKIKIHKDN